MRNPATQQERVERARPRAVEALQSLVDPRWAPTYEARLRDEGIQKLVRLALQDYRFRYPDCPARREWLFYDGDPTTKKIRVDRKGQPRTGRVDVYCTFCREILVNGAIWDHDYTDQVLKHTTPCALRSLAGLFIPGAPGTYRPPSEV